MHVLAVEQTRKSNTARGIAKCSKKNYIVRVHSTVSKCVYPKLNHELEVSDPFKIQMI